MLIYLKRALETEPINNKSKIATILIQERLLYELKMVKTLIKIICGSSLARIRPFDVKRTNPQFS